jgi:hypothetical protein
MSYLCPAIGSVVTVVTRYRDPTSLTGEDYRYNRYENVPVVDKDPWTKPGEFCIPADGEPYITKRTIHVDYVTELTVHGTTAEMAANTGTTFVKVPGSKGQTYTVTVVNGVAKSCECAGFVYRKHCRHLAEATGEKTMTETKTAPTPAPTTTAPKQARKPRAAAPAKKRTKAVVVRDLIRLHKEAHGAQSDAKSNDLINQVCTVVGFSRQLARAYIKANWSKV